MDRAAWFKLTEAQKEQVRQSRRKAGIPTKEEKKRTIGSLVGSRVLGSGDLPSNVVEEDDEVEVLETPEPQPTAIEDDSGHMICIRRNISMTQRPQKKSKQNKKGKKGEAGDS